LQIARVPESTLAIGLLVLALHGVLGGFDTLYNHEWDGRLPAQPFAARELQLHAVRSALYAILFAGLAWFAWHGLFAWLLVAIVVLEYAVTLVDSVVEDDTRRLTRVERVTHMLLGFTTGGYFALIGLHALTQWRLQPTALVPTSYGRLSVGLSLLAAGVVAWTLRDAIAARRLARGAGRPPASPHAARAR
jgi:hypothetical protein